MILEKFRWLRVYTDVDFGEQKEKNIILKNFFEKFEDYDIPKFC